jgi:hypothetical protein
MIGLAVVAVLSTAVIAYLVWGSDWRAWRRRRLRALPFPGAWEEILRRRVPLYTRLPEDLRRQVQGHVQVLLAEKQFVGCAGVQVTDDMRLVIASQAALLLLNRRTDYFAGLATILVYPAAFFAEHEHQDASGVRSRRRDALSGESWDLGQVVISWDDVERGGAVADDGVNVVLHEFAHQLDQESGAANGAPPLKGGYRQWSEIMAREYEQLRERAAHHHPTLLDPYGAQDPAEFFAVATEVFFERGADMQRLHPELYAQLRRYYCVDTAAWGEGQGVDSRDWIAP